MKITQYPRAVVLLVMFILSIVFIFVIREVLTDSDDFVIPAGYKPYYGKYIETVLPETWVIFEYENGSGSAYLKENTGYMGFTGLLIINDKGDEIFKMQATPGYLEFAACDTIPRFADTNYTYIDMLIQEQLDYNDQLSADDIKIIDLTAESEFYLFSINFRRNAHRFYYDQYPEERGFDPVCGNGSRVINFTDISFSDSHNIFRSYELNISDQASTMDLTFLDSILTATTIKAT